MLSNARYSVAGDAGGGAEGTPGRTDPRRRRSRAGARLRDHRGAEATERRHVRAPGRDRLSRPAPARAGGTARERVGRRRRPPPPRLPDQRRRPPPARRAQARLATLLDRRRGAARVSYGDDLASFAASASAV